MDEGARSPRHCPWRHAAAGPRRKLLAAAPVSRAQTPSSSIASWVCALGQGRRRATPAPPGSLCDLSLCARADGRRRTKASRARGGTLPQTKSFIRPQCAREVDGGRTRRPGLLEPLTPLAIPSLQCTSVRGCRFGFQSGGLQLRGIWGYRQGDKAQQRIGVPARSARAGTAAFPRSVADYGIGRRLTSRTY